MKKKNEKTIYLYDGKIYEKYDDAVQQCINGNPQLLDDDMPDFFSDNIAESVQDFWTLRAWTADGKEFFDFEFYPHFKAFGNWLAFENQNNVNPLKHIDDAKRYKIERDKLLKMYYELETEINTDGEYFSANIGGLEGKENFDEVFYILDLFIKNCGKDGYVTYAQNFHEWEDYR